MPQTTAPASKTKILGLTGALDAFLGIVLAGVGVSQDLQVLVLIGVVLLLTGGGMLAYAAWQRNKPIPL